ncbi:hypothetical protein P43SY_009634 [Pythium insidiosum]|uniref:Thioredoxin-like fold domain-containing protein n=1 Tax=Pythium insidiosum TaxID=114742 RepID=A0AAD5M062_PYTIN|nr:hypothetical protein P43SY_009634 [Pythium insidiosum]
MQWLSRIALAISAVCVELVSAQLPTPTKPPGFTYGHGSADAGVQLEAYIDLLCPFSKAALPGLRDVAAHYAPDEFRLRFVLFPLPYHQHAYAAAESAFTITEALGEAQFPRWLETVYDNQSKFGNKKTKNLSAVQVTDLFFQLAKDTFPDLTKASWEKGMTGYGGTDADGQARTWWKYTCTRGIAGTPTYTLNGVSLDADSEWDLNAWKKVLDPLVAANKPKEANRKDN